MALCKFEDNYCTPFGSVLYYHLIKHNLARVSEVDMMIHLNVESSAL